jgi:uncharacterized glyoxalase superfamily protein PhnB
MRLYPVFAVDDIEEAVSFYCKKLGFETTWTFGEPTHRAGVARDGVEIHLDAWGEGGPPGPSVVYFHMENAAAYYRQLRRRGVEFTAELQDRPWGMEDFRLEDPFGNRLGFASAL